MITWITALYNSVKLWAMPRRATQDGLVIHGYMDIYILGYNLVLFYLFCCLYHSNFLQLAHVLWTCPHHCDFLEQLFIFCTAQCSQLTFVLLCHHHEMSHCSERITDSFYWKMVFKNQDLRGKVCVVSCMLLLLSPFHSEQGDMCVYTIHMCTHLCKYFSIHVYMKISTSSPWSFQLQSVAMWLLPASSPYLCITFCSNREEPAPAMCRASFNCWVQVHTCRCTTETLAVVFRINRPHPCGELCHLESRLSVSFRFHSFSRSLTSAPSPHPMHWDFFMYLWWYSQILCLHCILRRSNFQNDFSKKFWKHKIHNLCHKFL